MPEKSTAQTKKQHAVPQNIMEVEFKLIGGLTMRQFVYLGVFGMLAYFFFAINLPAFIGNLLGIFFIFLGIMLAFVPVEDRGLDQWIINFFKAVFAQNQRVWRKEPQVLKAFMYQSVNMVKQEMITLAPTASRRKLERFLREEEKKVADPLDFDETVYIKKVHDSFIDLKQPAPAEATISLQPQQTAAKTSVQAPAAPVAAPAPMPVQRADFTPVTPDRLSGRKITSFLQNPGAIILPIKGEKKLAPIERQAMERSEEEKQEKTDQLNQLLTQIKDDSTYQKQVTDAEETKAQAKVATSPKRAEGLAKMTSIPNTLVGVVKNNNGDGIPNTIVIVKSERGDPVRAIKTNSLGQFILGSPLENGEYTLETDSNNTTGLTFDIIKIEAGGESINPVEIVGR